jgi:hypothetical protein
MMMVVERAIHLSYSAAKISMFCYSQRFFHGFDALKTTDMLEPCPLS